MEKGEEKGLRSRVFEVVSSQITEELIEDALESHKIVKKYAWICHDKDQYTQADEKKNPEYKAGTLKTIHYHVVLQLSTAAFLKDVAKWFGVPENLVEIPKGNDKYKFLDKVEYLPHSSEKEQAKGKYRYPDEAVHANFDWRAELDTRDMNKVKYGKQEVSAKERMRYAVLMEGKTLKQCKNDNPLLYAEEEKKLQSLRGRYLIDALPPSFRLNFYVEGDGGLGKGFLCRALARMICPDIEDDDEIFYEVGNGNSTFAGYDGQPVIIWHDARVGKLISALGDRGNVFNVFDTFPSRCIQNIKYGATNLINRINIVDGAESYIDFLNGLSGEYTDWHGEYHKAENKAQSYRRFPMMFVVRESEYDLLLNKGFLDNTREFEEYYRYDHIRGSFAKIREKCNSEALARKYEAQLLSVPMEQYTAVVDKLTATGDDEAALDLEFADYGKPKKEEPQVVYVQGTMETDENGFMRVPDDEELPFD